MDCDEVKTMLAGYADGELSLLERSTVESHLATCGRCRELVADQQRVRRVIESHAPPPVPDEKWTAMAKRLRAELGGKEHATLKTQSRIDSLDERPDEKPAEPQDAPRKRGGETHAAPRFTGPLAGRALAPLRPPSISVLKARPKKRRPRFAVVAHVAGALAASALVALSLTAVLRPTEFPIYVLGIHATNEDEPHIDPELVPLKASLERFGYNSFRLKVNRRRRVEEGKSWEQPLMEDYAIRMEPRDVSEKRVTLHIMWLRYEKDKKGERVARVLSDQVVTLAKGRYAIMGGWRLSEGAIVGILGAK